MGRIVALDIGRKRTGVAATDILQICANGLGFQPTHEVAEWLRKYAEREPVEPYSGRQTYPSRWQRL